MSITYESVLQFWFQEFTPEERFNGDEAVDEVIRKRFMEVHTAATKNEYWRWRASAEGTLAEIIVLDQFSRNIFRSKDKAFAADGQALALAQTAIVNGVDTMLTPEQRLFLYMPYMHSESKEIHSVALELFTDLGNTEALEYEKLHKDIINRFGRYPHRNAQLGRQSTPAEIEYLEKESKAFFNS